MPSLNELRKQQERFFELMINFSIRAVEEGKIRQAAFLKNYIMRRAQIKKLTFSTRY
jgi:hypothetical protein